MGAAKQLLLRLAGYRSGEAHMTAQLEAVDQRFELFAICVNDRRGRAGIFTGQIEMRSNPFLAHLVRHGSEAAEQDMYVLHRLQSPEGQNIPSIVPAAGFLPQIAGRWQA